MKLFRYFSWAALGLAVVTAAPAFAQSQTVLLGLGDSLGEGVQSDNAFYESQPNTYLNRIAKQMGVAFAQPLMSTSIKASVGSGNGRARLSLTTIPADLAVSGATINDILNTVAVEGQTTTEYDLVLPPYYGMSQAQIAQQVKPEYIICWCGTDDLITDVLSWNSLNNPNPPPTPLATFTTEYQELISELQGTGAKVMVGNIPDFTRMGYLVDNATLQKYAGTSYSLPAGSYTTIEAMLLIELGVLGQNELNSPAYTLTTAGVNAIRAQIEQYNAVIEATASAAGIPMLNSFALIEGYVKNPPVVDGYPIKTTFNEGAFSLDGVHPSDTAHALIANQFIRLMNASWGLTIPAISETQLTAILMKDPFADLTGTGVVMGRPYTGELETAARLVGWSSSNPGAPEAADHAASDHAVPDHSAAAFMKLIRQIEGGDANAPYTREDVIAAVDGLFPHARH